MMSTNDVDEEEEESWRGVPREGAVQPLLSATDQEFEKRVQQLDVRELLQLISCLQHEMALEQQRFDQLSCLLQQYRKFSSPGDSAHVRYDELDPASYASSGDDGRDETGTLSASLCRSQIRLAQLCNRNMRCFTQQAARSQQDRPTPSAIRTTSSSSSSGNLHHHNQHFSDNTTSNGRDAPSSGRTSRNGNQHTHSSDDYDSDHYQQHHEQIVTRDTVQRKLQGGGIPCPAMSRAVDPSPPPPTYPSSTHHQHQHQQNHQHQYRRSPPAPSRQTVAAPQPYRSSSNHSAFPPKYSSNAQQSTIANNDRNYNQPYGVVTSQYYRREISRPSPSPSPPPPAYSERDADSRRASATMREQQQLLQQQQQSNAAVPSVHDILRNVRSLRIGKNGLSASSDQLNNDGADDDDDERFVSSSSGLVARMYRHPTTTTTTITAITTNDHNELLTSSRQFETNGGNNVGSSANCEPTSAIGNEYDLVPTATQLLLRRSQAQTGLQQAAAASPTPLDRSGSQPDNNSGSHGYHEEDEESDDAISTYYDDPNDVRSGIRRSNLSCPQLASSDECYVTSDDLLHSLSRPESAEPGSLLADVSCVDRDNDDVDSGVGTEEHTGPAPAPKVQSSANRKRHMRRLLADVNYYSPSPVAVTATMVATATATAPVSVSDAKVQPTNGHNHENTSINDTPTNNGQINNNNDDDSISANERNSSKAIMSLELQPNKIASTVTTSANTAESDDDENYVVPSIIDQFAMTPNTENEIYRRQKGTGVDWNPIRLLEELYAIPQPEAPMQPPAAYINMEGYLEKLPSGRRQATFWNAWKRRYFQLKDGFLHCYQSAKSEQPSAVLQLMGGKIDTVETTLLGIDDGKKRIVRTLGIDDAKGHYIVVRCANHLETERWRRALITHTAENYALNYAQPVRAYPQFYEDVLIIDVGSCSMRAGILCNQPTLPQVYFPTVCAKDKVTGRTVYGKEALKPKTRLGATISFPLRPSAKITKFTVDLEAVKGLLNKVFAELNVDPSDYQIQLSLPRSFPFRSQTDVLNLLMTEFGVRAVNLTAQTVLALCSYNTTSGVVVDIGERMEVVPIVDGYVIESGVSRIPYGGSRLMDHLRHFLMQRHYGLVSETESFLLRHVLERACYCAEYYKGELHKFHEDPQSFETSVPIGRFFDDDDSPWRSITLDVGRFQAPEGLFNPDAWGLDNPGVHKLVSKAIQECSLDVRKEICKSIYLSGGVTMLPGFAERLQMEINRLTPPSVTPKVHASPYRMHAAYLGACVWASSPGFRQAKITRDEWIANGSACLKKWHF